MKGAFLDTFWMTFVGKYLFMSHRGSMAERRLPKNHVIYDMISKKAKVVGSTPIVGSWKIFNILFS
jgi:hypothetical protein